MSLDHKNGLKSSGRSVGIINDLQQVSFSRVTVADGKLMMTGAVDMRQELNQEDVYQIF